jgi:hypothetical protein
MMKELAGLLGVEKTGSKDELATRLIEYLTEPTAKGSKVLASAGRRV